MRLNLSFLHVLNEPHIDRRVRREALKLPFGPNDNFGPLVEAGAGETQSKGAPFSFGVGLATTYAALYALEKGE